MVLVDISKWKREPKIIKSLITVKGNTWVAKERMFILFPTKYEDRGLSLIDTTCSVFGVISISNEKNQYSILTVSTQITITPDEIEEVTIDDKVYYRLTIEAGNNLIDDVNLIVKPDNTYGIFELFLVTGYIPWYLTYNDVFKLFETSPKYTGSKLDAYWVVIKLLIAISARDRDNPKLQFRQSINNANDLDVKPILWVGIKNIYYSFNSTLSKIGGSYMKAGMISAIVNPEKQATDFENVVRK